MIEAGMAHPNFSLLDISFATAKQSHANILRGSRSPENGGKRPVAGGHERTTEGL
jgi:hypothetical protein